MGGATPTIANLSIVVQNIYIETVVTCTKFEVSYCSFSNIPILLLVYNISHICGRGTPPI